MPALPILMVPAYAVPAAGITGLGLGAVGRLARPELDSRPSYQPPMMWMVAR